LSFLLAETAPVLLAVSLLGCYEIIATIAIGIPESVLSPGDCSYLHQDDAEVKCPWWFRIHAVGYTVRISSIRLAACVCL